MPDIAELHLFPRDRVVRQPPMANMTGGRTDAVAVTHLGMTKVYECPQDMHAAVLVACAPELEAAETAAARRRLRLFKARLRLSRRAALRRLARDTMAGGTISVLAGVLAAVAAWSQGL